MTKDKEIKRLVAILGNLSERPKIYATMSEGPKICVTMSEGQNNKKSRYQKTS